MKVLYIAWSDREAKKWYPVGRLCFERNRYIFCYTKGARISSRFVPFGSMKDLDMVYTSEDLFPLFENRLLNRSRPEFKTLLEWLGMDEEEYDPLDVLALTEGKRGTDSLEVFPCPTVISGIYSMSFFSHGLRYLDEKASDNLKKLKEGDLLYLCLDPQNRYDPNAILLRSDDPVSFVGYCPRYLTRDFKQLLDKSPLIEVKIRRINSEAPMMYRIMCSIVASCPEGFLPCSDDSFLPIPEKMQSSCVLNGSQGCSCRYELK